MALMVCLLRLVRRQFLFSYLGLPNSLGHNVVIRWQIQAPYVCSMSCYLEVWKTVTTYRVRVQPHIFMDSRVLSNRRIFTSMFFFTSAPPRTADSGHLLRGRGSKMIGLEHFEPSSGICPMTSSSKKLKSFPLDLKPQRYVQSIWNDKRMVSAFFVLLLSFRVVLSYLSR